MTTQTGGTQRTVTVPIGHTATTVLTVGTQQVCQSSGTILFETERSFVEPTTHNKNTLQNLLTYVQNPGPHDHLLIVGHTDSTGSDQFNLILSVRRARSVYSLLLGDESEWETLFRREGWSRPEFTHMVVETGEADPGNPAAVSRAVNRHIDRGNRTAREALFTRYFDALLGRSGPPTIQFISHIPPWLGCGGQHLLCGNRNSPSRDPSLPPIQGNFQPNRRVEFFFSKPVSIPIDCSEYPKWTLACILQSLGPPPAPPPPGPPIIEWFVSVSGDNGNNGRSQRQAFRDIQYAVNHVANIGITALKVIRVMAGAYRENIRMRSDIFLRADHGTAPRIERDSSGTPVIICDDVRNVRIQSLIIYGRDTDNHGVLIRNSRDIKIIGNGIRNSNGDNNGGGILIQESQDIVIQGNILKDNTADDFGAGIYIERSQVTIRENVIEDNVAEDFGGGIAVFNADQDVIIERNLIWNNRTESGVDSFADPNDPEGGGGGIGLFDSSPQIRDNHNSIQLTARGQLYTAGILENRSARGGGIECFRRSYPVIHHNTIQSNVSESRGDLSGDGGGIAVSNFEENNTRSLIEITNNTINGNRAADDGGGVHATAAAQLSIQGGLIANNDARGNGGGVSVTFGTDLTMTNVTIRTNESNSGRIPSPAELGGGGFRIRNARNVTVRNCQFVGNVSRNWAGGAVFIKCHEYTDLFVADDFDRLLRTVFLATTGTYVFEDCTFERNEATGGSGAGAAIYALKDSPTYSVILAVNNSTFARNVSDYRNPSKRVTIVLETLSRPPIVFTHAGNTFTGNQDGSGIPIPDVIII
jgi:hypothetical protein